jgi:acetyl esterase/lipase
LGILPYYGTQDERSVYSSYGESVDIYATGTFIAAAERSLNSNIRSDYIFFSGTSMAAPQVAGVVGLYVSRFIELYRVAPTAQQVKNAMIDAEVPFEGSTLIGWAKTGSLYDPETLAGPASLGRAASGIIQNKILYWPYGTAATITTKTYTLSNNATNGFINEGNTVTFTLNTNNVPAGTTVGYTITGVSASDIDKELTGSFTLTSTGGTTCQATLAILIKADAATEGSETLTLTLTGRTESSSVIIQDSSTAPATTNTVYSLSSSVQTAVEGNYLTITLRTNTATENTTVTRYADVPYGSAPLQKADIYIPNGTVDGVVYYIHGGGWSGGTKNDLVAFSESLSLRGYAVVNVDYRLVGTAGGGNDDGQYPNNMNDVATAIDFGTRNTNTDSFSIHWAKVRNLIVTQNLPWVVCGDSAGGHLAILGTIKNGITNNVWPDAVWNSAGPSDLEFIDQYNDEILPLVYQDIITPYATTLTNQRNASPGYLYGSTSTPGTYKTQIDNAPTKFYFVTNLNDNLVSSESTLRFAYNLPDNRRTVFVIEQKSWLTTLEPPPNNTRKSAGGISHYYISNTLDVLSHNLPMIFGMYRNKFYSVTGVAAAYGLNNAVSVASHVLNANASDIIRFDVRLLHGNVATPTKVYWSINPSSTVSLSNFTDYPYNANDRFCLVSNYKPGYFTLKVNPSFTTYGILIIDVYEDAARTLKLGTSYRTYINPAAYSAPALTAGLCRTRYNGLLTNITQAGISALTVANQTIDTNTIDLGFSGTNYTINWSGFFIPDTTELYTFYADGVDDAFYLWIGVDAGSGFTNENSLISQTVIGQNSQANVYLHSGYRYIIRMIYLQNTSSETATISYSTPTIAKTTNFANRIYHISCP